MTLIQWIVFLLIVVSTCFTPFFINWGDVGHPFIQDINQYYSYLTAVFVDHDLTFKTNNHIYWLFETPTHQLVPKVTYGMAFFYSPFYLLAKAFADTNSTGYETIYAWFVHLGCIVYVLIGLNYTRKTLLLWFSEKIAALSLLLLFFGTNLFYYTLSESEAVHGILFFLLSGFVYHVIEWHSTNSKTSFFLFFLFSGFICLIRPTEIIVLIFPLLIGIVSIQSLKEKCKLLIALKWYILLGITVFFLPILPQLFFWKIQSGQWLFFSYGATEKFFWEDPQLRNVLISYRKGWLVYTPIMLFSIIGFVLLKIKNKEIFLPILLYLLMNIYLISAWWDWAFGGSFGMRALIQAYAFLIIPLAYVVDWVINKNKKRVIIFCFSVITITLCCLNIVQSNLYKHGIINFDGMTKEAYWFTFFKKEYSKEDLVYLKTLFKHPDYNDLRQGKRDE
jgi:hypothetical protein